MAWQEEEAVAWIKAISNNIRICQFGASLTSVAPTYGTVGTADGQYLAHLHFEVREGPYVNPGVGYADAPLNRLSPERFLAEHRGVTDELLNPAPAVH